MSQTCFLIKICLKLKFHQSDPQDVTNEKFVNFFSAMCWDDPYFPPPQKSAKLIKAL